MITSKSGHSSEEEEQIFLDDELQSDEEDLDDGEGAEERYLAARANRRRGCLEGCDCERRRGRRCNCELNGEGVCHESCHCDKTKCRTLVDAEPMEGEQGDDA